MRTYQTVRTRLRVPVIQRPLALALALSLGVVPLGSVAATISVTTTDDAGAAGTCTLRQAVVSMNTGTVTGTACANTGAAFGSGDTITFDTTVFPNGSANTITLADAAANYLLVTFSSPTIDASANGQVTIQRASGATNHFRIIEAKKGGSLTLNHLTLRNGAADSSDYCNARGGGICTVFANRSITLIDSTLNGNSSTTDGGGIFSAGSLTLTNSTLSANTALGDGGGISAKGAVTLINSTLTGNAAGSAGGAINAGGFASNTSVTLTNSTLNGNSAGSAGGIYSGGAGSNDSVTVINSIVASNAGGDINVALTAGSSGNLIGGNPQLGALADNGGSTQTMRPLSGSPAIDAIACTGAPGTDQRGIARPQGAQCDIGAVETAGPFTLTVDTTDDTGAVDGKCSLREAVVIFTQGRSIADTDCPPGPGAGNQILFAPALAANSIVLGSPLALNNDVALTIDGSGAPGVSIDGGSATLILDVSAGAVVTIQHLALANGNSAGSDGGAITNAGTLTLTDTALFNNVSSSGGGAILNSAALNIDHSTLSSNIASGPGGAIDVEGGVLTLADSSVTGNQATAGSGGGIFVASSATLKLTGSNVAGNQASAAGGGVAGNGHFTVGNSTFFSNTAGSDGGAIYSNKAASTSTVVNSTLAGNGAVNGGNLANAAGTLLVRNTILANSSAGSNCQGTVTAGSDVLTWPAVDATCGASTHAADPLLGPLQDNGGPTATMLPGTGSAAIDAGNTATCAAAPVNNLDQRGIARPQGTNCDVGAVEVVQHKLTVSVPAAGGFVATTSPANPQISACINGGGANCSAWYPGQGAPVVVTLAATPDSGYRFTGWGGDCSSNGTVTMNADKTCTAAFAPNHISGTITGLNGGGLSLRLDYGTGAEDLGIPNGNAAFSFSSAVPSGATYTVSANVQPSSLSQTCAVTNGSATMPAGDVGNVSVNCTTNTYTVGGNVSGLSGSVLQLQLNGASATAFGNGSFSFGTAPVASGNAYSVSVSQQPSGQICTAASASGTVTSANITSVAVICAAANTKLTLAIDDGHAYARYGRVNDYIVTLSNSGSLAATAVSVSDAASAGLDLANALWCQGATSCTPVTTGAISGIVDVPAHGAVTWLITVDVLATTVDPTVTMTFTAAGTVSSSDIDMLVLFHDSFDISNGSGVAAITPKNTASIMFSLPAASGNAIADVYLLQSGTGEVRVQSLTFSGQPLVRLLARVGAQEYASTWARAPSGARLAIGSVRGSAGERVILLEGALQPLSLPMPMP